MVSEPADSRRSRAISRCNRSSCVTAAVDIADRVDPLPARQPTGRSHEMQSHRPMTRRHDDRSRSGSPPHPAPRACLAAKGASWAGAGALGKGAPGLCPEPQQGAASWSSTKGMIPLEAWFCG